MQARACAVQLQRSFGFNTTAAAQEQQPAAKDETVSRLEQEIAKLKKQLHPGRLDACGCNTLLLKPTAPAAHLLKSANKQTCEGELLVGGLSIQIMAEAVKAALMPNDVVV